MIRAERPITEKTLIALSSIREISDLFSFSTMSGFTIAENDAQLDPAFPLPPTVAEALPVVLAELQGLSPSRWAAVRAVLDQVVMRPDLADEAAAELLHLLTARPDKRPGAG